MTLQSQIALGEHSQRQLKADIHNAEFLAAEMAALAAFELKLTAKTNP